MGRVLLFQGLVGLTEAMYLWLVAAGLSLIFGVLRVLNFAHGALYMIGAYLTYAVFRAFGGNFWVALLIGPVLVALVGWGLVAIGLWLFLEKTRWGLLVRATAAEREMARALGVRSSRLFPGVFMLGAWLAGLGG